MGGLNDVKRSAGPEGTDVRTLLRLVCGPAGIMVPEGQRRYAQDCFIPITATVGKHGSRRSGVPRPSLD